MPQDARTDTPNDRPDDTPGDRPGDRPDNRPQGQVSDLPHPAREEIVLTQVLFALSDSGRLDIVRQLAAGPMDMARCRLQDPAMPKSTKSHMMKVLRESGVLRNDPHGRGRRLSLRRADLDARFPGLLAAVLGEDPA